MSEKPRDLNLEAKPQTPPIPERLPSLLEKLDNLREVWQSAPNETIKQEFEARHRWSDEWKDYWFDCLSPMAAEFLDGIETVSQKQGDIYLGPTFRRCGKSTMGLILERFCTFFSTPEKPLPQFYYIDPQGISPNIDPDLMKLYQQEGKIDHNKTKKIIRKHILGQAALDFSLSGKPREEKLSLAETYLKEKEIIFLDEATELGGLPQWPPEERAKTLLSSLEVLKELCPKAIIFVTTGHGLEEGSSFEQLFCNLYKVNLQREQPLKMFERGLRDAWTPTAVMAYFFGREKTEPSKFDFREDPETFKAWLVHRITTGLRGYFNPYILDKYFRYYDVKKRWFTDQACEKAEVRLGRLLTKEERLRITAEAEAELEKAIANLNCLDVSERQRKGTQDSARKLLAGQYGLRQEIKKPAGIKSFSHRLYPMGDEKIFAIARVHKLDPQDFLDAICDLRENFDHFYFAAITDVLPQDALKAKLQIAEMTEASLAARLLFKRGKGLGEQTSEQVLADFLQILAGTEFSLRAEGATSNPKYKEILLPEPEQEE